MSKPTTKAIKTKLTQHNVKTKDIASWASFLTGLDWRIINPLVKMAVNAHTHPAIAAGLTANATRDQGIKATLTAHLERRAANNEGGTPTGHPNKGTPAS